jgi:hypothetical protein
MSFSSPLLIPHPISTPFYSFVRLLDSDPLCVHSGFNLHILVAVIFSFPLRVNEMGFNPDGSFFTLHPSTAQVLHGQSHRINWFVRRLWFTTRIATLQPSSYFMQRPSSVPQE